MEESQKKNVMLIVVVVCLIAAGLIFWKTSGIGGGSGGIDDFKGQITLMKCNNPKCGSTWEMDMADYFTALQEKQSENPMMMTTPPIQCPECGKNSGYRAIECPECGEIFFYGAVRDGFPDTCPKCKFSQIEEERKNR